MSGKLKLGLIGLVGPELKQDMWGTYRRIREIGYQGVEGGEALLDGDTEANVRRFEELGLQVLTVSARPEELRGHVDAVIRRAQTLHARRATIWWGQADSRDQLLADAELYERAGRRLAAEGITLCYHNHDHEFQRRFDGLYALDLLVANTHADSLAFEIDIAWVTFGQEDPARVLRRLAGRVAAIHVKDLARTDERGHFTAPGTGVVGTQEALLAAIETGVEWAVVEQDKLRNLSALETVLFARLLLKEWGLA